MPGIYYVLRELDVRPCRLLILVAGPFLWFMVLLVGDVAQGQLPLSAEEAEDVALMTRLQEQVMALPEDSREEDGLKNSFGACNRVQGRGNEEAGSSVDRRVACQAWGHRAVSRALRKGRCAEVSGDGPKWI